MNSEISNPIFPALHRAVPKGWINDPNGIHKIDDTWHLMWQWNPHSARHHLINWGHATSTDLLHWTAQPAALTPDPKLPNASGCWSGVGLRDKANGGVSTLVYSAVSGENLQLAQVMLAKGNASGGPWTEHKVVVPVPEIPGLTGIRDPFIFEAFGHRFAIQGAGIRRESGEIEAVILSWLADDLEAWQYLGEVATGSDEGLNQLTHSTLWECPQLAQIDGAWVLIVGLWDGTREERGLSPLQGSGYAVGDLQLETDSAGSPVALQFTGVSAHGLVDQGPDFYAPQVYADQDRVLLWGWSWEGAERSQAEIDAAGWAGCLTFPRELSLHNGVLVSSFAKELRKQADEAQIHSFADGAQVIETDAAGNSRVVAELQGAGEIAIDASIIEVLPKNGTPTTVRAYGNLSIKAS